MDSQCNSCGSFQDIVPCQHCATQLCVRCKAHHEMTCKVNQGKKQRGEGPTVRYPHLNAPIKTKPVALPPPTVDLANPDFIVVVPPGLESVVTDIATPAAKVKLTEDEQLAIEAEQAMETAQADAADSEQQERLMESEANSREAEAQSDLSQAETSSTLGDGTPVEEQQQ